MGTTGKIAKTGTVFMAAIVFAAGGLTAANCSADAKIKGPKVKIKAAASSTRTNTRKELDTTVQPERLNNEKQKILSQN